MRYPRVSFVPRYKGFIPWSQRARFFGYEAGVNWVLLRAGRFVVKLWIA